MRKCQFMRLVPRTANLIGRKCQKLPFQMIDFVVQIRFFSKLPAEVHSSLLNQQFHNRDASFTDTTTGNVSQIGNLTEMARFAKSTLIFPQNRTFFSETTGSNSSVMGSIDLFFFV